MQFKAPPAGRTDPRSRFNGGVECSPGSGWRAAWAALARPGSKRSGPSGAVPCGGRVLAPRSDAGIRVSAARPAKGGPCRPVRFRGSSRSKRRLAGRALADACSVLGGSIRGRAAPACLESRAQCARGRARLDTLGQTSTAARCGVLYADRSLAPAEPNAGPGTRGHAVTRPDPRCSRRSGGCPCTRAVEHT